MINKNNKFITKIEVENILNKFLDKKNYINVENLHLYQTAFKNCSYLKEEQLEEKSNENLEILGDSILNCIVVEYLEKRFHYENEGFISKIKMDIIKTEGLEYFAKQLGMQKYILISSEEEKTKLKFCIDKEEITGRENPAILENCFEAFIGALFLDKKTKKTSGYAYDICSLFITSLIENLVSFSELILKNDNYKNIVQNYFHSRKWVLPIYRLLYSDKDKKERKIYTTGIYISRYLLDSSEIQNILYEFRNIPAKIIDNDKILVGVGQSYTIKGSEQLSAKKFITLFCPEKLDLDLSIF